jgi:hypothetical protein
VALSEIRQRLGLTAGSRRDFIVEPDGSLRVRPLQRGSAGLFGLLHEPQRPASTVEQMDEAVGGLLAQEDTRAAGSGGLGDRP